MSKRKQTNIHLTPRAAEGLVELAHGLGCFREYNGELRPNVSRLIEQIGSGELAVLPTVNLSHLCNVVSDNNAPIDYGNGAVSHAELVNLALAARRRFRRYLNAQEL